MNVSNWMVGFSMFVLAVQVQSSSGQTRLERVLQDRIDVTSDGFWIYNDLALAQESAARSGRLMLVTFRCIPCEECVKLDEELIESDPQLRDLLNEFVRVRIVATNNLDLNRFQFDFDQSFAIQVMDADGTVYARYGTRSDRTEWRRDVSIEGLTQTLKAVLESHKEGRLDAKSFAGKQPGKSLFPTPNHAPTLVGRFPEKLEFNDNVVKNCIHCHMIGDAQREYFRTKGESIPDRILFQFPHPRVLGLTIDPHSLATITNVRQGSVAERARLRSGDQIVRINGQPIYSMADIQWVLHHADSKDSIEVDFDRDEKISTTVMKLDEGWRREGDLEWRATSWPLRRMVTGGLRLTAASDEKRGELGIDSLSMALEVTHVGQYGKHALAKRAGFRKGDVIVAYDGETDLMRESDLLAYGAQSCMPGQQVSITFYRDRERQTLKLLMQE